MSNRSCCCVQVNREARVDCALAELYSKSVVTDKILQEQKHAEVLTKLYTRMNEVSFTSIAHLFTCMQASLTTQHRQSCFLVFVLSSSPCIAELYGTVTELNLQSLSAACGPPSSPPQDPVMLPMLLPWNPV